MKLEFPTFRRSFVTGLLILTPVVVTGWVFWTLFRTIDNWLKPLVLRIPYLRDQLPPEGVAGIGFVTVVLFVFLVGLFANNLIGRAVFGGIDRAVARIPWIKGIYGATKDLSNVIFSDRSAAFRKVILFEYPRRGIYSIGFVTNELTSRTGDVLLNVFLPTTPNPTSGYFLMVPGKDAIPLDISIEDGLKLVVSGGAVLSDARRDMMLERLSRHESSPAVRSES